jgi:prepilin peptidase CpaA
MSITPQLLITAPLVVLLCAAAWHDAKSFRIPNAIIVIGVVLGIALNSFVPTGLGFSSAALGMLAGLVGLFPLYLLRIWGAGDVKLMAVVGAFLGVWDLFGSLLVSLLVGGVLAIIVALRRQTGRLLFDNLRYLVYQLLLSLQARSAKAVEAPASSAGKVAYAVPILLGTAAYLVYRGIGIA